MKMQIVDWCKVLTGSLCNNRLMHNGHLTKIVAKLRCFEYERELYRAS